jgi:hypothetical protein
VAPVGESIAGSTPEAVSGMSNVSAPMLSSGQGGAPVTLPSGGTTAGPAWSAPGGGGGLGGLSTKEYLELGTTVGGGIYAGQEDYGQEPPERVVHERPSRGGAQMRSPGQQATALRALMFGNLRSPRGGRRAFG